MADQGYAGVERTGAAASIGRHTVYRFWAMGHFLTAEIGVVQTFLANGGGVAVARVDLCIVGQGHHTLFQRRNEGESIASGEVCAANGLLKQAVAGKKYVLLFAIKADTAGCVARSVNYLQLVSAEGDNVSIVKQVVYGGHIHLKLSAQQTLHLQGQVAIEFGIIRAHLRLEAILLKQMVIAQGMVEMGMCVQNVLEFEVFP